jgi:hypothetical protein
VTASISATPTIQISVYRISRRRSAISPIEPAGSANTKNGSVDAVCVNATYSGLAPNDTISQAEPTFCMNVPTSDTTSATSSWRKIGVRSGRQTLMASARAPGAGVTRLSSIARRPRAPPETTPAIRSVG